VQTDPDTHINNNNKKMLPWRPTQLPIVKPKLISEQALGFKSEVYFFHREIINVSFLPLDSLKFLDSTFIFFKKYFHVFILYLSSRRVCYEILHKQLKTHNKNSN
jgi:hypothetical protein